MLLGRLGIVLLPLEPRTWEGRSELVHRPAKYREKQTHCATIQTYSKSQNNLACHEFWETHQNPVRLLIKYSGPKRAGLLLYLNSSCILVHRIYIASITSKASTVGKF